MNSLISYVFHLLHSHVVFYFCCYTVMIKQFLNIRVTYIMALRGMLFQAKRIGLHYNFEANIHGISTFTSEIGTFLKSILEGRKITTFSQSLLVRFGIY